MILNFLANRNRLQAKVKRAELATRQKGDQNLNLALADIWFQDVLRTAKLCCCCFTATQAGHH